MATLLEQTRLAHEEMERLERLVVAELSREARTHRERLLQSHRVAAMVEQISARAVKLVRSAARPPAPRVVGPRRSRLTPARLARAARDV